MQDKAQLFRDSGGVPPPGRSDAYDRPAGTPHNVDPITHLRSAVAANHLPPRFEVVDEHLPNALGLAGDLPRSSRGQTPARASAP